ncbi:MAG: hypothetical protein U9R79_08005 [Armatimonadota bacterium]|nr:hypothetical protein [Armatimonadota bacterium]
MSYRLKRSRSQGRSHDLPDAARSEEPVIYRLSPLADAQWRATFDWANHNGRCEVALHAVGDPSTRTILYLACGEQDVSSAICSTRPQGVAEVARQAATDKLRVLGQAHHHPMTARMCEEQWDPHARFFLSRTDYVLLDQLSTDLSSGVAQFERVSRQGPMLMRAGQAPELTIGGRRFRLKVEAGTEITSAGMTAEGVRPVTHVFVAVTGSDGLLHGEALRTELCSLCFQTTRRSLHPLELRTQSDGLPSQYAAAAFDRSAWEALLDRRVRRAAYWTSAPRAGRQTTYSGGCRRRSRQKRDRREPSPPALRHDLERKICRLQGLVQEDMLETLQALKRLAESLPGGTTTASEEAEP